MSEQHTIDLPIIKSPPLKESKQDLSNTVAESVYYINQNIDENSQSCKFGVIENRDNTKYYIVTSFVLLITSLTLNPFIGLVGLCIVKKDNDNEIKRIRKSIKILVLCIIGFWIIFIVSFFAALLIGLSLRPE